MYYNKTKSQALFSVLGLQSPAGLNNLDSNTIIHQSRNIVKGNSIKSSTKTASNSVNNDENDPSKPKKPSGGASGDSEGRYDVNEVTTILGKRDVEEYIIRAFENNAVKAMDKEKAESLFQTRTVQYDKVETTISFDYSIAFSTANVKYPKEKSLTKTTTDFVDNDENDPNNPKKPNGGASGGGKGGDIKGSQDGNVTNTYSGKENKTMGNLEIYRSDNRSLQQLLDDYEAQEKAVKEKALDEITNEDDYERLSAGDKQLLDNYDINRKLLVEAKMALDFVATSTIFTPNGNEPCVQMLMDSKTDYAHAVATLTGGFDKRMGTILETVDNSKSFDRSYANVPLTDKTISGIIKDYFEKLFGKPPTDTVLENSNKQQSFYEYVVGVGDMHDTGFVANPEMALKAVECLREYAEGFGERNPNFHVFNSVIHCDEATPHLHYDFIPFADGYKTGMTRQQGISKALEQMGYGKGEDAIKSFTQAERKVFREICEKHGIEIADEQKGRGETLTTAAYREYAETREKTEELQAINEKLSEEKDTKITQTISDFVSGKGAKKVAAAEKIIENADAMNAATVNKLFNHNPVRDNGGGRVGNY